MGTNWRYVEARTGRTVNEKTVLNALAQADAVFVGEQHNDPQTHLVEFWLWQQLAGRWRDKAALAMEMLERDGQKPLDDYLAGRIDEPTFRKSANFWKTYDTDYRVMVEDAKKRRAPVVGSNAPQVAVRKVGREGLAALTDADKTYLAWPVLAPEGDDYHKRFVAIMNEGAAHGGRAMSVEQIGRTYQAQCVRDQAMADAVAKTLDTGKRVMHVNGSFHSDAGLGTVQRLLWLRPRTRVALVKCHAVTDPTRADVSKLATEADWLVIVPSTPE